MSGYVLINLMTYSSYAASEEFCRSTRASCASALNTLGSIVGEAVTKSTYQRLTWTGIARCSGSSISIASFLLSEVWKDVTVFSRLDSLGGQEGDLPSARSHYRRTALRSYATIYYDGILTLGDRGGNDVLLSGLTKPFLLPLLKKRQRLVVAMSSGRGVRAIYATESGVPVRICESYPVKKPNF